MSRHQEFDYDEVLYQAMKVFWRKGYEATSITDLLKATGLSKSSLYATFESKHNLFLLAFDAYKEARRLEAIDILGKSPARNAIEEFYRIIVQGGKNEEYSNGCMSINQAVEMAPHDEEVRTRVNNGFKFLEDIFAETIKRGRSDGSVKGLKTPQEMAKLMIIAFPGLQVMARSKFDQGRLEDNFRLVISILDE